MIPFVLGTALTVEDIYRANGEWVSLGFRGPREWQFDPLSRIPFDQRDLLMSAIANNLIFAPQRRLGAYSFEWIARKIKQPPLREKGDYP